MALNTVIKCRSNEINFINATFEGALECNEATFRGPVGFNQVQCGGGGFFLGTKFMSLQQVDFGHAFFDGGLVCNKAIFRGPSSFYSLRCMGSGLFNGAQFESPQGVNFSHTEINGNLAFGRDEDSGEPARFAGPVDLTLSRVSQALALPPEEACFQRQVLLHSAAVRMLVFENSIPFAPQGVDLRRCTFEEFAAGNFAIAQQFAQAQHPEIFSRDPYLQLEKFYRNVGDEVAGKKIHYLGRRDARENAKSREGGIEWPRRTRWGDWWIKWLTGYGVRTYYLLVPILFFLIVGTCVFWSNDALIRVDAGSSVTLNEIEYAGVALSASHSDREQGMGAVMQHLLDRTSYSLDLFLPLVNLHVDEDWTPKGPWRTLYGLVHQMVGWILVPLLLASLAGIVRRE